MWVFLADRAQDLELNIEHLGQGIGFRLGGQHSARLTQKADRLRNIKVDALFMFAFDETRREHVQSRGVFDGKSLAQPLEETVVIGRADDQSVQSLSGGVLVDWRRLGRAGLLGGGSLRVGDLGRGRGDLVTRSLGWI